MNPIGVVICNYNKKDFVLQCVQSVLESKEKNFDIYVVDNASSDGSAEALKKAIEAGRSAYLSGLGRQIERGASASSPLTGFLED